MRAAKASKYKNPINDVGVTTVYGMDDPKLLEEGTGMVFLKEYDMTPVSMIAALQPFEKIVFKHVFAGKFAKSLYRMYEYRSI